MEGGILIMSTDLCSESSLPLEELAERIDQCVRRALRI
jgi:hypothetical protein